MSRLRLGVPAPARCPGSGSVSWLRLGVLAPARCPITLFPIGERLLHSEMDGKLLPMPFISSKPARTVPKPGAGKKLGEGTFGSVIAKGDLAVKSFDNMETFVAEVFITRYVSRHCGPNVIKLRRRNLSQLTMCTQRWACSLQDVLWKRIPLSISQARSIFKGLLYAVADLEALRVVHADIKPGNIFLSPDYMTAVLGDFGVSSISGSARVGCTTKQYSSSQYANYRAHDCFGVAIVGLQLLYGYQLLPDGSSEYRDKSAVRADISRLAMGADREALLGLVQDDPRKCWHASKVLEHMYQKVHNPRKPAKPSVFDAKAKNEMELQIAYHTSKLCTLYKVRKLNRCKVCSISLLSRLGSEHTLVYVTAMVYIFRCVFGFTESVRRSERMQLIDALEYCNASLHDFTARRKGARIGRP